MDLLRSNFIYRARRLPKERRSFLLAIMEKNRKIYKYISKNPLYERYSPKFHRPLDIHSMLKRQKWEAKLALQMGSVSIWLVLDNPKKRNLEQIKQRIREIDRLVMFHGFRDVYEATSAKIEGYIVNETFSSSDEKIPETKQKVYENRMKEYIRLNDSERKRFVAKIQHPIIHRNNNYPIQMGHLREI
jgi:hypothetical protein